MTAGRQPRQKDLVFMKKTIGLVFADEMEFLPFLRLTERYAGELFTTRGRRAASFGSFVEAPDGPATRYGAYRGNGILQKQREQTAATKAAKQTKAAPSANYHVGDTVRSKVFGLGVVLSVKPMGSDNMLEIAFETAGTKKLMANYAKLEVVK